MTTLYWLFIALAAINYGVSWFMFRRAVHARRAARAALGEALCLLARAYECARIHPCRQEDN